MMSHRDTETCLMNRRHFIVFSMTERLIINQKRKHSHLLVVWMECPSNTPNLFRDGDFVSRPTDPK